MNWQKEMRDMRMYNIDRTEYTLASELLSVTHCSKSTVSCTNALQISIFAPRNAFWEIYFVHLGIIEYHCTFIALYE
jgi:hypothetical protein